MAESRQNVVEAVGLRKTFLDFWGRPKAEAVKGIDFTLGQGQVLGFLGPNGSGKSTTVKMMLGLLRPTSGSLKLFGRGPDHVGTKHRIGYLPEETYLYKFLDAGETLRFYGRLFGLSRAQLAERVPALIAQVGLEHARHRRLGEYSKGMARRLGLAQALINDPDLVILDEPTSGLDPLGTAEVKELIIELKRRGKTVLLSSHLLADVEDVCDRIAILHQGQLKEAGRVADLLTTSERTLIELDAPDPAVLDAVRAAAGDHLRSVDHPRERLEAHFRRIVSGGDVADAGDAGEDGQP